MLPQFRSIVDISLELDPKNFAMRTPAGFKKDMQFEMEVIKEHDAPGGAGQIVRGVRRAVGDHDGFAVAVIASDDASNLLGYRFAR